MDDASVHGETVEYVYDELGRLRTVVWDDGVTIEYRFDAAGNRVQVTTRRQPPAERVVLPEGDRSAKAGQSLNESETRRVAPVGSAIKEGGSVTGLRAPEDPAPGTLMFETRVYPVNENAGAVSVVVRRADGSAGEVSVSYRTSTPVSGACLQPARAESDYVTASGTLHWSDGDVSSRTIAIQIADDSAPEVGFTWYANEEFDVSLFNPTGGAEIGGSETKPGFTRVTIADDDPL
jgi:YD repeat-containing protein